MRRTGVHGVYALGLREAGTAQRNGFTAARTTSNDPRPPPRKAHQPFLSKQSALCAPAEWASTVYSRKSEWETWGLRDTGGWHDNDEHYSGQNGNPAQDEPAFGLPPLRPEDELPGAPSAISSAAARPDPCACITAATAVRKLADLLVATGLDAPYRAARGAALIDASGEAVTDFVGGFGAALLGHNPPELKRLAVELLESDTPVHVRRGRTEKLLVRLRAACLGWMPGNARYVAHFSNSGTEAIEAALKHAYKVHLDRVRRHHEGIARETNELYHQLENREITAKLPGGKRAVDFRDDLNAHNLEQFESFQKHPV